MFEAASTSVTMGSSAGTAAGVMLFLSALHSTKAILDVGEAHACADVGSSLKCWGNNQYGQLGRGDANTTGDEPDEMGDNLIAVDLGSGGEVAADAALGGDHTCALLDSGDVKCFGYNADGQLGQGDTEARGEAAGDLGDNLPAVDFGSGLSAVALATGCDHTCALLDDGSVKCFGYGNYGQLGQGDTANVGDEEGEMGDDLSSVSLGDDTISAIAAGCDFTCALTSDGAIMCWGRNTWGQLGAGDSEDRLDEPDEDLVVVDLNGSTATAIAAGEGHVCALLADSSVKCWGRNNNGQLGLGDNENRGDTAASMGSNLPAVELGADDVPVGIDLGSFHTCVLLDDGAIKCFGENASGELGIGSTDEVGLLPTDMGANLTAVQLGDTASDLSVGGSSACAVLSDESIKCWGRGNSGQLGQEDDENIGDVEGVLENIDSLDLGTDTALSDVTSPAPSALVTMTSGPTAYVSVTSSPSFLTGAPTPAASVMTSPPSLTSAPTTVAASVTSAPTSAYSPSTSAPSAPQDTSEGPTSASLTLSPLPPGHTHAPTVLSTPGGSVDPASGAPGIRHGFGGVLATVIVGTAASCISRVLL